jgi:1-acyl-sn-glycerol-3-phosphate acyltransferase
MSEEMNGVTDEAEESRFSQALLQELLGELNALARRLQALTPGYTPPPFTPRRILSLIEETLERTAPQLRSGLLGRAKETLGGDLLDIETWKGLWYLISYAMNLQADLIKRRFSGKYETDDWGLDWELLESVIPLLNFMYEVYWRVQTTGVENIPAKGRTLLVSNHSGQLPWDGAMVGAAVWNAHPNQRLVRALYSPWFATLPFLSALLTKMGQAPATVENGKRLLEQEALVAVFPEGHQGASKLYKDRYQLARFGRGEFVKMALSTQAPIIPVAVVGAEETYITLANSDSLARLLGVPHFPITPTFPWLGLLGLVPLPTQWHIDFGEPIPTEDYGPDAAMNPLLIKELTEQVREVVQGMVQARLAQRGSVFFGK